MRQTEESPTIIQGGMGVGVSNWRLANAVSMLGQMGVVSGTALDTVLVRRLQLGDPGEHMRRALARFPWPKMAQRVLDRFFVPGGKPADKPFKLLPMPSLAMERLSAELLIVANFVEVFLAREGHDSPVGINYLEKIQLPTLPSLFGAMLAGVNFILMGGGIPLAIPGVLDGLARGESVELSVHVEDNPDHERFAQRFDPAEFSPDGAPPVARPKFLAIVASDILAKTFIRRAAGYVDGFIVENYTAGGHNAPPRNADRSNGRDPEYGEKDIPDIAKIRELGRPFWLAGGYASPARLREAIACGASGIQVGTAFAYSVESGLAPEIRRAILARCLNGGVTVTTDFAASPTGYPFKIIYPEGASPGATPNSRKRICDLGYLRELYRTGESSAGYRCRAERVESYVKKGGLEERTVGKHCLCNGLLATIGLGQPREEGIEPPLITAGDDFSFVEHFVRERGIDYTAKDVVDYLRGESGLHTA